MATFGDLLWQHLSRKRGLSQNKLAWDIDVDPSVISKMCNGKRLNGRYSRERVLKIIAWLHTNDVLDFVEEANTLLEAAGMMSLAGENSDDAAILNRLEQRGIGYREPMLSDQERITKLLFLTVLVVHILGQVFLILRQEKIITIVCSERDG